MRTVLLLALALAGCADWPAIPLPPGEDYVSLRLGSDRLDLLFVIDNSNSPVDQQTIGWGFHGLLESLRSPLFGGGLPDLRVGVVSSDLGAGDYGLPGCEEPGGDGGKLLSERHQLDCGLPMDPWVSHIRGRTNVRSGSRDPLERVFDAFRCIAEIGSGGCGFEQHLEAARRALDPALEVNPGFQRADSLLAVVIVTDEDDCSAARPELFDPSQRTLRDPLGPLTSFRCAEFGLVCDEPLRAPGPKHSCRPGGDWLVKVEDYVAFLGGLRPPGRTLLFSLTAPAEPVEVVKDAWNLFLKPACTSAMGKALPAPRLAAVAAGLGPQGLHNPEGATACAPDFIPAFRRFGALVLRSMGAQCLGRTPLTRSGQLACTVEDVADKVRTPLPPCPVGGADPSGPCWRIRSVPDLCAPAPHAIQILRPGGGLTPVGATTWASCAVVSWQGSTLGR